MEALIRSLRKLSEIILNMSSINGTVVNGVLPKNSTKNFAVCIEGNIASGKTTLLDYFRDFPQTQVIQEPVKRWRDCDGHNTLGLMYDDPKRWGLTFQTYVQLTMLDIHTCQQNAPVKMIERSIYSARYCFVENLLNKGLMAPVEYCVLSQWFDWIQHTQDIDVDLIVYLRTEPETCYERIKSRNRSEEKEVPLEYLQTLHDLHEDWLIHERKFKRPAPILILDANQPLDEMRAVFEAEKLKILGERERGEAIKC